MDEEELVLVIPRETVVAGTGWRGIRAADLEEVVALVNRGFPAGVLVEIVKDGQRVANHVRLARARN